MSTRAALFSLAATLSLASTARADDGPSPQVVERVMRSVVQVKADDCAGSGPSRGTGFVFGDGKQVATALHVIAGCRDVRVLFERPPGQDWRRATVDKVTSPLDLALLRLDADTGAAPLAQSGSATPHEALRAIGYAQDQPSMEELPVTVSVGLATLRDFLPDTLQQELQRTNPRISLSSSIVRFASPLNPGMSGGPIIDATGGVVAVVGGGLRNMPAPPSWGWPASGLPQLLQSRESPSLVASLPAQPLMSFRQPGAGDGPGGSEAAPPRERRQCGTLSFDLTGRRTFRDVAPTADDVGHLRYAEQVAITAGLSRESIESQEFDVWRNKLSGAVVLVPRGVDLLQQNGFCMATSPDRRFGQIVVGEVTPDMPTMQMMSVAFENRFVGPTGYYGMVVQPDPTLTTTGPQLAAGRPDQLSMFNRKAVIAMRPTQYGPQYVHLFETLLARNGTFIGIMTINEAYGQIPQFCFQQPAAPACGAVHSILTEWAPFVFGTQLSSYPVY